MQISKYSASGNDFVIFHAFEKRDRGELAKILCHRQEGIGADGMVVVLPHDKYDFQWQFYNCDGSEASMCGNASRAVAHYAYNNGLAKQTTSFLTDNGVIKAKVEGDVVESQMAKVKKLSEPFERYGFTWYFYDSGVPHLVSLVDDIQKSWEEALEKEIIQTMRHDYNANVNFVTLGDALYVRTYERGVEAETLACGTGMVACFLALLQNNIIKTNSMQVYPKSGALLEVRQENNALFFKGAVKKVFECVYEV